MPASLRGSSDSASTRVLEETAERDLRGADETEIGVGDRVDLRLFAARVEAEAVDDLGLREIGRRVELEAVGAQHLDGEALEREVEQHGFVLQVVELGARHLGAGLEVDEVVALAELEMVERLEVEARRFAGAAQLARVVLAAVGHVGVDEVRDARRRRCAARASAAASSASRAATSSLRRRPSAVCASRSAASIFFWADFWCSLRRRFTSSSAPRSFATCSYAAIAPSRSTRMRRRRTLSATSSRRSARMRGSSIAAEKHSPPRLNLPALYCRRFTHRGVRRWGSVPLVPALADRSRASPLAAAGLRARTRRSRTDSRSTATSRIPPTSPTSST